MINSLVAKFYSPLATILETSFEGLNRVNSYAKFLSINMNLAKAHSWGAKKGTYKPFPFQVSAGSLPNPEVQSACLQIEQGQQEITTMGALATAIIARYDGLQDGDQVTVIGWNVDTAGNCFPKAVRFYLDTSSNDPLISDLRDLGSEIRCNFGEEIAAWIFSRWDGQKWARSTSYVSVNPDVLNGWITEAAYAEAVASFMKGAGQTPVSDVYLNGSDE